MTKQTVGIGAAPNDGTGDGARVAFDKINDNFNEIYGVSGLLKSDGVNTLSAAVAGVDFAAVAHVHAAADITTGTFADALVAASNVTQHQAALSITESQISDLGTYLIDITGENLSALADVTITGIASGELLKWNGAAWVNNTLAEAGIAAAGHNHAAGDITSGTFADALVAATNVTQHQAALSLTESQISDLQAYLLPADIASGTITARTGAIDFSGGSDGDVLTVQADGSLAPEAAAGGAGTPGGADTQVQFNDGGSLGGDANFTWDKTTEKLFVGTDLQVGTSPVVIETFGASNLVEILDNRYRFDNGGNIGLIITANKAINWVGSVSNAGGTIDVSISRDSGDTLALRRDSNAQTFNVYGNYGSSTDYQRMAIATTKATASAVSGASVTLTNLIPAGAHVLGVTSKVNTALGTGNGTTAYQVGDGVDDDRFGDSGAVALGTVTQNSDWTADTTTPFFAAANDIVLTAVTGNFDGTGEIEVSVQYIRGEAD